MCGIAGFVNFNKDIGSDELLSQVTKMTNAIIHRGPDEGDHYIDIENGLALGHRRLSIIDLSEHGHQPMTSNSGRYIIVYNGEIYNFQDIRRELRKRNYKFKGHSDTEVLLACIEEYSLPKALKKLNGMFAFALWDKKEKTLSFARDRLGKKPLYYGFSNNILFFASELKALRTHPKLKAEIDREAVSTFLQRAYVPSPGTIYKDIKKLPQACYVELPIDVQKELQPSKYWNFDEVTNQETRSFSDDQAIEELDSLLNEAVSKRMISDVPLGSFLSGGIDSSLVTAIMQKNSDKPIQTYSIGFKEAKYNEAADAKKIAQHFGTNHTEFYVTAKDALDTIPQIPEIYDEPFADPSQIPTYLLSKLARQHVTVALSGDGGDESFYGYARYNRALTINKLRHISFLAPVMNKIPANARVKNKLETLSYYIKANTAFECYDRQMSYWQKRDVVEGMNRTALLANDNNHSLTKFMMEHDTKFYLPDDILVKVDRASMAASLETRAPLSDYKVVEFAWSLDHSFKYRSKHGKWILKQLLEKYLPRELFDRPKQGFGIPHGEWIQGPLKEWAEDLLDEKEIKEQGFLNAEPLKKSWKEHINGTQDHSYDLWAVLMFQSWIQKWG